MWKDQKQQLALVVAEGDCDCAEGVAFGLKPGVFQSPDAFLGAFSIGVQGSGVLRTGGPRPRQGNPAFS